MSGRVGLAGRTGSVESFDMRTSDTSAGQEIIAAQAQDVRPATSRSAGPRLPRTSWI